VKNIHRYALGEEEVMTRDDIIRLARETLGKPEPSAFVKPGIKVGVRTQ
jgi:hypothetical protein